MDKKLLTALKALDEKKAIDIQMLKLSDLTVITDYFIIAAGTSNTHVRALAEEVEYKLGLEGFMPRQIEGKTTGWILLDYSDVLIHVFTPDQRELYNLEKLWADAERVDISDVLTED